MADAPSQTPSSDGMPLSPFDRLMLADDRPGCPMSFFAEFQVSGPLCEHRLRQAVDRASRRHPLLRSRLVPHPSRPAWRGSDTGPTFVWHPREPATTLWRAFDLRQESGLRVVVLDAGPLRHRAIIQVHHAVCDGVSALEYAGDVWAAYAGLEPRPFSVARGRRVSVPEAAGAAQNGLREAWAFARFRPVPLAPLPTGARPPAPPREDPAAPPYAWMEFDKQTTDGLREAAIARGGSLNDLVVAAVMRAAVAWNRKAGRRAGNVRITMPVSLRPPGHRQPACNDLGYAFLDRRAEECVAAERLTESVAASTRWVLENQAARFFLDAIAALGRWPGLLWLATRLPVCFSTAVVSNVGDPARRMRCGVEAVDGRLKPDDVVIERCFGVPPSRPRTRVSIGATTYAGRLTFCCLCSAHRRSHEGASVFLEHLRQSLAEASGSGAIAAAATG